MLKFLLKRVQEEINGIVISPNKIARDVENLIKDALLSGITFIVLVKKAFQRMNWSIIKFYMAVCVKTLEMDYTIVRASWFMQKFRESFFLNSIMAGHVALPQSKTVVWNQTITQSK